ncbi:MAG: hypothetical protein Q8O41_00345 [Candidatus Methanoperedens sp.]|nr:hypothetical protein [Candidatus Methanoperedens sp.]
MGAGKKNYSLFKWVLIALIISGYISAVSAAVDTSLLQWGDGVVSGKLYLGETITYNGYTVEVVLLPPPRESEKYSQSPVEAVEPYVGVNISQNGKLINTTILGLGDWYILPNGELRVIAKEFPSKKSREWVYEFYKPWVVIKIDPRGKPNLKVSVDTETDEYLSSSASEIKAVLTMQNTGLADVINVDVVLRTELPVKRESLKYHFEKIKRGETITKTVTFSSPMAAESRTYGILANMTGYDVMGAFYKTEFSKSVRIIPEPEVSLSIRKSANEKVYLKDFTIVSLSVANNGKVDLKNVSITDSIPEEFKLVSNVSLNWVTDIQSGRYWDFHYLIKPVEPNSKGIALPAATAEFRHKNEYYNVQSTRPVIAIYGPRIVINKQTDVTEINPGDPFTVTIVVENQGNTPTKVSVIDQLPERATLISGSTAYEGYFEASKQASFSYTLKIDSDQPFKLPGATADYFELGTKGRKLRAVSQEPEIKIKPPEIKPVETPIMEVTGYAATVIPTQEPTPAAPEVTPGTQQERQVSTDDSASNDDIQIIYDIHREVDTLLNFLLGCNDLANTSRAAYAACNFYHQTNTSN